MSFVDKCLRDARSLLVPDVSDEVVADGSTVSVVIPGLDGEGTQVFNGRNERELIAKLTSAQTHGTRKIRELSRELKALRERFNKLSAFIVELSRCKNRLSPEANEVFHRIARLIETQNQSGHIHPCCPI